MNENGYKTNVASRLASVFGYFGLENSRKCIECRKNMKFGVGVVDGDAKVWKKFGAVSWSRKKIVGSTRKLYNCTKKYF